MERDECLDEEVEAGGAEAEQEALLDYVQVSRYGNISGLSGVRLQNVQNPRALARLHPVKLMGRGKMNQLGGCRWLCIC